MPTINPKPQFDDPDFDVELEMPSLESVIPKETLKKLKPKEKKRQDVINGLYTISNVFQLCNYLNLLLRLYGLKKVF